jgi:hypothetical protein
MSDVAEPLSSTLPFIDGTTDLNASTLNQLEVKANRAQANGYASLDASGKVPTAQLPAIGGTNLVYHGDYVAGTYNDGDLVVYNGILYMCTQTGISAAPSSWPPPGAQDAIPKSLIDNAGDLLVGTANDTVAKLPVGTLGQILTRISAAPGVGWQNAGNPLLYDSGHIASAQTFDVSGLPGTYTKLVVDLLLRSNYATAGGDGFKVNFNGDTAANYAGNFGGATNATGNGVNSGTTYFGATTVTLLPDAGDAVNIFGLIHIEIPFYTNTVTFKSLLCQFGATPPGSGGYSYTGEGVWKSLAAINRFAIVPNNGTAWAAGSRCVIWGVP